MSFTEGKADRPSLDDVDLNILKFLSEDSKMALADLGKKLHLTAPAIHARIRKLERVGVLRGYSIDIDYEKIGLPVMAFVRVQIGKVRCRDAGKELAKFKEIEECHAVAGEDDLILKTRTATPLELQNLLDKMKTQGLVEKSISILVLESHFERSRV